MSFIFILLLLWLYVALHEKKQQPLSSKNKSQRLPWPVLCSGRRFRSVTDLEMQDIGIPIATQCVPGQRGVKQRIAATLSDHFTLWITIPAAK